MYGLALVWTVFAVIQDFRKTEVSDWLNFSLLGVALAYRAFYSLGGNWNFFIFGVLGFLVFFVLSQLFYYSGVFGGGDAKLMWAYGAILPFNNFGDLFVVSLIFIFALFFIGAVYSLIYSLFIVIRNFKRFEKNWKVVYGKYGGGLWGISIGVILVGLVFNIMGVVNSQTLLLAFAMGLFPWLFAYLVSLDKAMVVLVKPGELQEGDWIMGDVLVAGKIVKKTVHGLSFEDINLLKKHKKSVLIKRGIPYTVNFLFALLFMLFFSEALILLFFSLF